MPTRLIPAGMLALWLFFLQPTVTALFFFLAASMSRTAHGLTLCAERNAIAAGIAAGHRTLVQIAITVHDRTGNPLTGIVPCGACLQVIAEFGTPDAQIVINGGGIFRLADFLPRPLPHDELRTF